MKHLFKARLILTSVRKWHYIFWLIFPLLALSILTKSLVTFEQEVAVPISVIDQDESVESKRLIENLQAQSFIRMIDYNEDEAYQALETHQLEAVFVIREGFSKQLRKGKRGRLVTGYQTEFTLTYPLIKEVITSMIQEDLSRTKAYDAYAILNAEYKENSPLSYEDFLKQSLLKMEDENLLTTELIYSDKQAIENKSIVDVLDIWLLMSFLATLFMFDWLVLENTQAFKNRLLLSQYTWMSYLLFGFLFITGLTLLSDFIFHMTYGINQNIGVYLNYRIIINLSIFFIASYFTKKESYYKWTLIFFLLFSLMSGLIIPIDRLLQSMSLISKLHPVYLLSINEFAFYPLCFSLILISLRFVRGGFFHVRSKTN